MPCDIEPARRAHATVKLLFGILVTASLASCSRPASPGADEQMSASEHADAGHADEGHEQDSGRVTLSETAFAAAGIVVDAVTAAAGQGPSGVLEVPGEVVLDPRRVAMVSARVHGIIDRLEVAPGVRIATGDPVALLFSSEFLTAQRDFQRAATRVAADTSASVRSLAAAARSRLALMGVPNNEIEQLAAGENGSDYLAVRTPLDGTILEVLALQGTAVEPGQPIARIADLRTVYVTAEIAEEHLRHAHPGLPAQIRLVAYPDTTFTGPVERIHDELNPETRRGRAYIAVRNTRRLLKPGMFATVRFILGGERDDEAAMITIPVDAVLRDETGSYVFVEVARLTFERRAVDIASSPSSDLSEQDVERVVVLRGLTAGERIVTSGAFTLKSEIAKGSFGEHAH